MARSLLIAYEPLNSFIENKGYWNEYITFYEKYWGGPTSPFGVWFGNEYETFREALSNHLGIDEQEIEDCFFMKDKEGYYISPLSSKMDSSIIYSDNYILAEWFVLFKDEEREFFFTPWGFGGIHYATKMYLSLQRLIDADRIIKSFLESRKSDLKLPLFHKLLEIQAGIAELQTWLSGFDPSGYVLLNYGEICSFIHPYTMKNERSVKEIWDMLSLVKEGLVNEAKSALNAITEKWEDIGRKASGDIDKSTIQ